MVRPAFLNYATHNLATAFGRLAMEKADRRKSVSAARYRLGLNPVSRRIALAEAQPHVAGGLPRVVRGERKRFR